ncbi:MAG: hypothetical protein WCF17_20445 [Terracidiphilus sp.]
MDPVRAALIQRVEDEFGINVSDGEALKARTAGDLHALLMGKLKRDDALLLARALYQARRALANGLGVPRQTLGPATRLAELVPPEGRVERWNRIARVAGEPFPGLRLSRRLQDRIMLASMAVASPPVIALWWALYALDWIRGIWALLFSMPAALAFLLIESRVDKHLLRATARRATELPCETVQELAQQLVEMNPVKINRSVLRVGEGAGKAPSSEDVWVRLAGVLRQSGGSEQGNIMPGTAIPELENAQ